MTERIEAVPRTDAESLLAVFNQLKGLSFVETHAALRG